MKGGFYGIRGKQLSLILISLVGATILVWTWEKNPLLTSFIPPPSRSLQISSEVRTDSQKEKLVHIQPANNSVKDLSSSSKEVPSQGETGDTEAASSLAVSPGITMVHGNSASRAEERETSKVNTKKQEGRTENLEPEKNGTIKSSSGITELRERQDKEKVSKTAEQEDGVNVEVPTISSDSDASLSGEGDEKILIKKTNQGCNYAKGKWVMDDKRPFYSGFDCKQWLSAMWACRLTQRTNFDYERLRWQPLGCQMEEFGGAKFLKKMRGKTLAFVGDSLGRQQFQSMMCMVTGGQDRPDVLDVGKEYGLVKAKGAIRPDGWAYRFPSTNTTILYYWSASLCDLEPINRNDRATEIAMHLDRPPAFLKQYIKDFDVLVLNTGHHWNRGKIDGNHWVMHVGGAPNTDRRLAEIGHAKNFTVHSIVKWVDLQLPKHPRLKAFFRTISPRHFVNGDWNTGGSCDNEAPTCLGKVVTQEESSDPDPANAVKGTGVRLLDITALSQVRDEGHISRFSLKGTPGVQDCLHWCLPGVPDSWNEILFAQI